MAEYVSGRRLNQQFGVSGVTENDTVINVIGRVAVGIDNTGIGTTTATANIDTSTIRIRDTVIDSSGYGGALGYFLTKDINGLTWTAVPPLNNNAIFVASDEDIIGVSSFTGLNFITNDNYYNIATNPINTNFADITVDLRWYRDRIGSGGIYTTTVVGIGSTIPRTSSDDVSDIKLDIIGDVSIEGNLYARKLIGDIDVITDDLFVSGVSTFIGISTFGTVGIGTTNVVDNDVLTIVGDAGLRGERDTFRVGNAITMSNGIVTATTFDGKFLDIEFLNVTGIGTINSGIITNLKVTGVSTFIGENDNILGNTNTGSVQIDGGVGIDKNVSIGGSLFVNTLVGIGTSTNLDENKLTVNGNVSVLENNVLKVGNAITMSGGIVTATKFDGQFLDIELLNVTGIGTINSGIITNLRVTGVSTFIGISTFGTVGIGTTNVVDNDVLTIVGDSRLGGERDTFRVGNAITMSNGIVTATKFDGQFLDIERLNVTGIGTINSGIITNLRVTGFSTFGNVARFDNSVNIYDDLFVSGNISVGGTGVTLDTETIRVESKELLIGFTTSIIPNDTTANAAGIAVASTEGWYLVDLQVPGINTTPNTYKQFKWFKNNTFVGQGTDAFITNQPLSIGNTQIGEGTILAIGNNISFSDNNLTIPTLNVTGIGTIDTGIINSGILTNLNVTGIGTIDTGIINNLSVSGIATIKSGILTNLSVSGVTTLGFTTVSNLYVSGITTSDGGFIGNLTGTASTASFATTAFTLNDRVESEFNVAFAQTAGIATNLSGGATGQILYQTAPNVTGFLITGGSNQVLTSNGVGQAPSWRNAAPSGAIEGISIEEDGGNATPGFAGSITTLNFTGTPVSISANAISGVATITIAQDIGGSNGIANTATNVIGGIASVTQLYVSGLSTFVGIGTFQSDLFVGGDVNIVGVLTAERLYSNVYGEFTGGSITGDSIVGTALSISGISTLGKVQISSGIVTATSGVVTYYGGFIGNLTGTASTASFATTAFTLNDRVESEFNVATAVTATNVIGGIASVTQLSVSGVTTLGFTTVSNLYVSGITTSDGGFIGNLTGTASTASFATTAFTLNDRVESEFNVATAVTSTNVVGGIGSLTSLSVSGIITGTLANDLTLDTSGIGLSGIATYNNSGVATFTVTSNATDANTNSTIVARDGSGNFSAGTITANLTGTATTATNLADGANITTGTINDDRLPDLITSNINISSGISSVATLDATNATIDNLTFTSGIAITSVDTDLTTVSASDDTLASAKAIKNYVDNQVGNVALDFAGDAGTGNIDLDSETFTIAGTANEIETIGAGNTLTIGLPGSVAISTSLTVGSAVTITSSGITVASGIITALQFIGTASTASFATTAFTLNGVVESDLNVAFAQTAGIATYTSEWTLGANGISDYTFTGPGFTGAENDPTLYLTRGEQYKFINNSGGHPFRIQSTPNGSVGTQYNDGITNNDAGDGTTLLWNVQFDSPDILYYQCTSHSSMGGKIYIVNAGIASDVNLFTTGISTLGTVKISAGIITSTTGTAVTYYGDGSNLTELTGASAATYGDASTVAQIEVDANGRITNITEVAISGGGGGATDKIEEGNTKAEVIDTGSDGRFIVETEGVERLRINSTGNVGIGTDDPSAKLEVSTGSTSLFLVNDNVTDGNIFELNKSDGDLAFSVDATTGNVAIGQTEATSKLVVDGDVFISGILTSNNLSGTARFDAIGIGTDADTNIPLQVSTGSTVLFSVNDNVTDGVIFGINDVNSKSLFSVDADGTVLFRTSGNVGIGTTIVEPSSKLVVDGDVFITGVITSSNMSVDLTTFENINVNETVETQFLLVTGVSTFNNTITGTATTANNLSNAANITTGTINSARLTGSYDIDITGDAGTATTATNVTGAIGIGTAPDSNIPIQVSTGSTSIFLVNNNTSDGNIFELNKSDGDLAFAIDSVTGNVAIGQTEATSKLVVDGDVFISGILTSNNFSDTARFDALGIGTDADLDIPLQVSTGSTVLFSVNHNVTDGVIFGINDANSKSLFSVDADGTVLFRTSGNVGIGTTIVEPSSKLVVGGDISATNFNTTSDARLKTNIQVIGDPLKKVLQINGVSFNWIENNKPSLGVIADNIQEILPELVTDTNPKTVNYNGLIGLLIEVVKQQQDQINSLNDRVSRLE